LRGAADVHFGMTVRGRRSVARSSPTPAHNGIRVIDDSMKPEFFDGVPLALGEPDVPIRAYGNALDWRPVPCR
jgi:hypothetical protein